MQVQLLETLLLNIVNHQSLIATKARRITAAAEGRPVMEFGARRAQGPDASVYGARAAVIGGCASTSNVLAAQRFNIPAAGTMAHSWIEAFPDELSAFRAWAKVILTTVRYWSILMMCSSPVCPTRLRCSRNSRQAAITQLVSASTLVTSPS